MPMSLKYTGFALPLFILSIFLFSGCSSHEAAPMTTETVSAELIGKVWKLQSLFSREVSGDQDLTLEFMADGTVKGFGGCNNFTGTYTLEAEKLTFGPLAGTKKTCGAAIGEQEYTLHTFLAQISRVKVEPDRLELYSDKQTVPMVLTTGGGGWLW